MTSKHPADHPRPKAGRDGFDVLDLHHRQTVFALGKLSALVAHLESKGLDAEARELADEVVRHFSTHARQHHEDEERHVFPRLVATADKDTVQTVLRLQQDHGWIEEDWMELSPHLDAVASGQGWYDLDLLREGVAVFVALMHDHISLEESIIYPEARTQVGAGERREMGREMAQRRRAERLAR